MKDINIIPYPRCLEIGDSVEPYYESGGYRRIVTNTSGFLPSYFKDKFECETKETGQNEPSEAFYFVVGSEPENVFVRLPDCIREQEEGYYLKAGKNSAFVTSCSEKGLFYGVQTLRQLMLDGIDRELEITDWPRNAIRGFHLETRYGMPIFCRILEIIEEAAYYKFNTLLIEFEDKYPYSSVPDISSKKALTMQQIKELSQYARHRFMEIIPLQQTLGHLEYVLKKDEYYHLREVRGEGHRHVPPFSRDILGFNHFNNIDEICLSSEEACKLVALLLGDVMDMFPASSYIHIGCDEAWNLSYCGLCREKNDRNRAFIIHVNKMAAIVKAAGKIPVMWDDMLRHFDDSEMELLDKDIVLVSWLYYKYETGRARELVRRYRSHGYQVLGASAAKCSAGLEASYFDIPDFSERTGNMADWSEVSEDTELSGIITTIWSNYTGTIAPPHPFFDTAWYSILLSADMYWNSGAGPAKAFEARFFAGYFGAVIEDSVFSNSFEEAYSVFEDLCEKPLRHQYVAETYKWMYLLSLYKKKSLATDRELYKLCNGSTGYEKEIVMKRAKDLSLMRQHLKNGIGELMGRHYREAEVKEFLDSRFFADEVLEKMLCTTSFCKSTHK